MKSFAHAILGLIATAALLLTSTTATVAATIELTDDGISIASGADAKYTLAYPQLVNAAKKTAKIENKKVDGRKATLTYEGGGRADLALGDGEIALTFADVPADTKMIYSTLRFPTASGIGAKWFIGGTASGEFPKDKPAKPFMFQGNATTFELISPSGAKIAMLLPDFTYHQLQDNREWGASVFQWQFWAPYYPENPRCVIKVGDASVATAATPAPATPVKVAITRAAIREEPAPGPETGATKIMKWKDGRQAVFMLEFDDSCESHIKNVIPELKKRGMVGTFYINPGNGPFKNKQAVWEKDVPAAGMELANHTFTHSHAFNVADFERELTLCSDEINKCYPDRRQPRLISYGPPGGIPKEKWLVTKDEVNASLAKLHLIERPSFYGPPFHLKNVGEVLNVADLALSRGEMGHLDFHGVGGDWLVTPMDWFLPLLDKLEANRDLLWITDPISWHKYLTERKASEIKVLAADTKQIRLLFSTTTDTVLYDMPLTLATRVPPEWKNCSVTQSPNSASVASVNGVIRYSALPGTAEIILRPSAGTN